MPDKYELYPRELTARRLSTVIGRNRARCIHLLRYANIPGKRKIDASTIIVDTYEFLKYARENRIKIDYKELELWKGDEAIIL